MSTITQPLPVSIPAELPEPPPDVVVPFVPPVRPVPIPYEPPRHRWTFEDYLKIAETGILEGGRTELIDGEILDVAAQYNPHAASISKTNRLLVAVFDESYWLTIQSTVRLRHGDGPDPDFGVRPGPATGDQSFQPQPLLIIEVSVSTLLYDQVVKSSLYAANGVEDYWIINVNDRQLEVYRNPVEDSTRRFGWRYGSLNVYRPPDFVSPLVKPEAKIEVAKMLP